MNVIDFFCGALAVCSTLLLWFVSPLKITLGKIFFKQNFITLDQFDTFVIIKYPLLSKLLSCWICLSFWLSLAVGVIFVLFFNASIITPLITFFVYPSICFVFKQLTRIN